jgi:hypothetical protein
VADKHEVAASFSFDRWQLAAVRNIVLAKDALKEFVKKVCGRGSID